MSNQEGAPRRNWMEIVSACILLAIAAGCVILLTDELIGWVGVGVVGCVVVAVRVLLKQFARPTPQQPSQ